MPTSPSLLFIQAQFNELLITKLNEGVVDAFLKKPTQECLFFLALSSVFYKGMN